VTIIGGLAYTAVLGIMYPLMRRQSQETTGGA